MQRKIIVVLALLCLLLAAALGFLLLRGESRPPHISVDAADENGAQPYRQEMDCIDQLLRQSNLSANDVDPALARCRGGAARDRNLTE
jgi:hypothetical protein